jgi:hypothetical protein
MGMGAGKVPPPLFFQVSVSADSNWVMVSVFLESGKC